MTVRTRRQLAAAVTWNAMIAIALILTIASIAVIIAGILGADSDSQPHAAHGAEQSRSTAAVIASSQPRARRVGVDYLHRYVPGV